MTLRALIREAIGSDQTPWWLACITSASTLATLQAEGMEALKLVSSRRHAICVISPTAQQVSAWDS